jgi:nickel-dependent lactate racemase
MSATFQIEDNVTHLRPAEHESVPPEQLAEAVRSALEKPLGYPPLCEATVPGDEVIVAPQHGLPLVAELMAGTSTALRDAGIEPSQTTVLFSQELFSQELSSQAARQSDSVLDQLAADSGIHLGRHDPNEADDCAYVGVTQSGVPLKMNRLLSDADIVLPVGITSVGLDDQLCDKYCGLFPHYCDQETITHYRDFKKEDTVKQRENRRRENDESGWLLGVGLTVQVVPGVGGTVAAVLAGEPTVVAQAATEKYRQIWSCPLWSRSDLVIATITGLEDEQSWDDLARALAAAQCAVEPGGAIAICSHLTELPGPSLGRLIGSSDYIELERELRGDHFADTRTALKLCRALEQGTVYLHSGLADQVVESLGLAPISSETELSRLVESYHCPIVLEDAHRLLPTLSE